MADYGTKAKLHKVSEIQNFECLYKEEQSCDELLRMSRRSFQLCFGPSAEGQAAPTDRIGPDQDQRSKFHEKNAEDSRIRGPGRLHTVYID